MALKKTKPTSPGRRFQEYPTYEEITRTEPEKSLVTVLKKSGGRNSYGRITSRHRGGGHRRHYRVIDFKRDKNGIPAKVASIEYDPNRSARIALLHYVDGEKRYILAPLNLGVGDMVMSGADADIKPGNALPLNNIPLGTLIHNVELQVGKGGQIVRSAGGIRAVDGQGRQIRPSEASLRGGPHGVADLQGHDWTVGQRDARKLFHWKSGPQPLAGPASQGSRRRHEPGGSSHGRW